MKWRGFSRALILSILIGGSLACIAAPPAFCGDEVEATNRAVRELYRSGQYVEGLRSAFRAVEVAEQARGTQAPETAIALYNLAEFQMRLNQRAEAERALRRALSIDAATGNERSLSRGFNKLASLMVSTLRFDEARALYSRAYLIDVRLFGSAHRNVARDLNNMAVLLNNEGKAAESESFQLRAIEILRHDGTPQGEIDEDLATALCNLAEIYRQTERADRAEQLYRHMLATFTRHFGPDHPRVGVISNNLADVLRQIGKYAEAEQLYRRAISIETARVGADHPYVATYLNNLANLLRDTHRQDEAAELYQRALRIDEASAGEFSPAVARDLKNFADLLRDWKGAETAVPVMRRVVEILERKEYGSSPELGQTLRSLGDLVFATGQSTEAEKLYRRALEVDREKFGHQSERVLRTLESLAALLRATERVAEADQVLREARDITRNSKSRRSSSSDVRSPNGTGI